MSQSIGDHYEEGNLSRCVDHIMVSGPKREEREKPDLPLSGREKGSRLQEMALSVYGANEDDSSRYNARNRNE